MPAQAAQSNLGFRVVRVRDADGFLLAASKRERRQRQTNQRRSKELAHRLHVLIFRKVVDANGSRIMIGATSPEARATIQMVYHRLPSPASKVPGLRTGR
jgi:hypothetical protein